MAVRAIWQSMTDRDHETLREPMRGWSIRLRPSIRKGGGVVKMLTAEDIAGYLETDVSPHTQARNDLVLEIRNAVDEAIAAGDAPEGTPYAATFTVDELTERGLSNAKGTGPGLKKSRNGNGPIAKVARLSESEYLIVLDSEFLAANPEFPETGGSAE